MSKEDLLHLTLRLLSITFLLSSAPLYMAQSSMYELADLPGVRAYNCGLSTAAFLIRLRGQEADIGDLGESLNCGDQWEYPVSLGAIRNALAAHGVRSTAYAGMSFSAMLRQVAAVGPVLAHLDGSQGHFLVFLARRDGEVCVVEPGKRIQWAGCQELERSVGARLSGLCIVVPMSDRQRGLSRLEIRGRDEIHTVELGSVWMSNQLLAMAVPIKNRLGHPLVVRTAISNCSCLQSARLKGPEKTLPPDGDGEIEFLIDTTKLTLGNNTKKVMMVIDGPDGKAERVYFQLNAFVRAPDGAAVVCLPEYLSLGYVRGKDSDQPHSVRLILPTGVKLMGVETSSSQLVVVHKGRKLIRQAHGGGFGILSEERFEVRVSWGESHYVDATVSFKTSSVETPIVRMRVTGRRLD